VDGGSAATRTRLAGSRQAMVEQVGVTVLRDQRHVARPLASKPLPKDLRGQRFAARGGDGDRAIVSQGR
jgi:hypothetical protein